MNGDMMMQTYDGADVVDALGEPVGTVERSYVDESGTVRLVEVAIGSFFPKYRLIPVADAQLTDGRLAVPYTKDVIVESPDASPTRATLEGALLERVWASYGSGPESTDVAMAAGEDVAAAPASRAGASDDTSEPGPDTAPRVGEVRDRGDVIEIPIVEDEVEVVRRPVVKEVLRVRKDRVTEQQTIDTTVRKERIEVTQDDDLVARDNQDDTSHSR
jgi:Domain of unknown function (DUF2382)/PRC-barrel domain